MKRVVFLHGSNDLYGASSVLLCDACIVKSLGFDVAVVLPFDGPLTQKLVNAGIDVSIHSLRVLRRVNPLSTAFIPVALPSPIVKGTIVVLWTLALLPYLPKLKAKGIMTVLAVHEIERGRSGGLLAFLASFADLILANSNATARFLSTSSRNQGGVYKVYPAAPLYEPEPVRAVPGELRVFLAGRVNGFKGHVDAVEAIQSLRRKGIDATLTLAGAPYPGQESHLDLLRDRIRQLDWVTYIGEVSNSRKIAADHDVWLSATRRPESFGLVALESWSIGRRFIGPDEGGMAEAARLVDGVLYEPRNSVSMADCLEFVAGSTALMQPPSQDAAVSKKCTAEGRRLAWNEMLSR